MAVRAQEAQPRIDPMTGELLGEVILRTGENPNLLDEYGQPIDVAAPIPGEQLIITPAPVLGGDVAPAGTVAGTRPVVPLLRGSTIAEQRSQPGQLKTGDFSQDLVDVRQRPRPELAATGIRAGGFTIFPQVATRVSFTDNVTRALSNKKSDMLYAVSPSLRIDSNWGRHALSLQYSGDYGTYLDTRSERILSTNLAAQGRIDFSRADQLTLRASFATALEERDNVDVPAAVTRPGFVTRYEGQADYQRRFNRATINFRGNYALEQYGDSQEATGNQDNSDRDLTDAGSGLRLSYDVGPALQAFVDGEIDRRDYLNVASGDLDRSSWGWRTMVGVRLDATRRLRGEVSAGYLRRDYDASGLSPTQGPVVDANLAWLVTPLTTVVASAGAEVDETTLTGSSGVFTNRVAIGIAHELQRNVMLSADLGFERQDYKGADLSSSKIVVTMGANYQLTRNAALSLTGVYEDEISRQGVGQYVENSLTLGLV
ncbi:MAG: outer membrane beta-barrel protein, partial [Hyphomicrobiales bacterium]